MQPETPLDPSCYPRVTIGILSWNRLHYLRATLESARECIRYPNIEWIVSDNLSVEPGLREYLESLDWVDRKIFKRQSHGDAMNELVETASGEILIIWPEDVQFVVQGDWMIDVVELLMKHDWIGSVALNYMRRITYDRLFTWAAWKNWRRVRQEFQTLGLRFRRQQVLESSRGFRLRSFGWVWPGVVGSGIPSIARTETWRKIGPWKTAQQRSSGNLRDSSLGAEADMDRRLYQSGLTLQQAMTIIPVAADIVTDPSGSKAKVRGDKRYGVYMAPPEGTYYYRIFPQEHFAAHRDRTIPLAFEDWVEPLGFSLPFDEHGSLKKSDVINMDVVQDI